MELRILPPPFSESEKMIANDGFKSARTNRDFLCKNTNAGIFKLYTEIAFWANRPSKATVTMHPHSPPHPHAINLNYFRLFLNNHGIYPLSPSLLKDRR